MTWLVMATVVCFSTKLAPGAAAPITQLQSYVVFLQQISLA